jgi:superoxide reductase
MKLYRCSICGNLVELLEDGGGTLVCCGEEMIELPVNSSEVTFEKHIPVIEKNGNKVTVRVGEVTHPMLENHYIMWIAIIEGKHIQKKLLNPGEEPKAEFEVSSNNFTAYAYCNVHGFYRKDNK